VKVTETEISDLTDAELDRLGSIIEAGKHLRGLRDTKVAFERSYRLRMEALDSEINRTSKRLVALSVGGAP